MRSRSVAAIANAEWTGASATAAVRRVRVALLGYGRAGQAIASLAEASAGRLRRAGVEVRFVGALVRDRDKRRGGPPLPLTASADEVLGSPCDVLIDVMGGVHPALELVSRALLSGVHVVTANKTLVAAHGPRLEALARRQGVAFAYDAAVLAGVPFLGAIARRPLVGSPLRIAGIINGTSHFITCRMAQGDALASALREAVRQGYAEPDSSADVGGRDAAEKLTILLHLAGCAGVSVSDLPTRGIDTITAADLACAEARGAVIKPVAMASLDPADPGAWVGPALVANAHPFAALKGVQNAIEFAGPIGDPVTFSGPGAGPRVTAATILDDVVEALAGGRPIAPPAAPRPDVLPASAFRRPPNGLTYAGSLPVIEYTA